VIVGSVANVKGIDKTSNLFRLLLLQMAERLGTDADWHAAVMASESGFSPSITNSIGATGLIQFMPATARKLGTTTDALRVMTAEEQLEWVERYYQPFAGRMHSVEDVYMATFMPVHVGKSPDNVISTEGHPVYDQNRVFDRNKDGSITNREVGATARGFLDRADGRIDVDDEGGIGDAARPFLPGLSGSCSSRTGRGSSEKIGSSDDFYERLDRAYAERNKGS